MAKAQAKTKRTTTAKKAARKAPARQSTTRRITGSSAKSKGKTGMEGSLLEDFFVDSLKDIYWAEKALTKALPKMSKSATSEELKKAFNEHLEVTKKQVERLEQVFELLGKKAQAKKCDAMQGLVEESESIISETKEDTLTRDAALIIAAQKVEHYEIATYGGLCQLAKTMNKADIAKILGETLAEEKNADEQLTTLAEGSINTWASTEPESEEKSSSLKDSIMSIFSKNEKSESESKSDKSEKKKK